ncbi:MAG: integrase [Oscillospiraceae bacterium]|nr:integrase [Oscillospiraceae bacterium]
MSETVNETTIGSNEPVLGRKELIDQRAQELARDFSYDGYQVVRKELFAHLRDPAVVIRRDSVTFNTACIDGLEDVVYINILVNSAKKKMVVRKCGENDKDAIRWCVAKPDKRKSRKISGKVFTAKLYKDMDWNADCRYKVLGYRITFDGETIYIFDLAETEIFLDIKKKAKGEAAVSDGAVVPMSDEQAAAIEQIAAESRKLSRQGYMPEQWENSYGLPVEEHGKALQVDIREGYAQFDMFPDKQKSEEGGVNVGE